MKLKQILVLVAVGVITVNCSVNKEKQKEEPLHILLLTSDDLNFDSVGIYGSVVKNATPNTDRLAQEGLVFERAYVQAPSCTPSRNVMITGNYSHNSGVEGFFSVDYPQETLPEALRNNGYYTGVIQKVIDMTPTNNKDTYWDYVGDYNKLESRTPKNYGTAFSQLIQQSKEAKKPFFASVNIQDPHLPFFRGAKTKEGFDRTPPSYVFQQDEVPLHSVLPQFNNFKEEFTDYYNTVKRGDDAIGEVLKVLEDEKVKENTLIVYLSDHGMSFPFVKSNLYPQSVRTPFIVVWPRQIKKGMRDNNHMISAIDIMPTLLEVTNTPKPGPLAGRSLLPIFKGENQKDRDYVFVEYNEGPTADPRPMRAVHSKDFVYVFNAWGTGDYHAIMECRWYRSWATYAALAKTHKEVSKRFEFLKFRTVEELYDTKKDPYAKNNLINDPAYASVLADLRGQLEAWMRATNDFALEGYLVRDNPSELRAFMEVRIAISKERQTKLEWKRGVKNPNRPEGELTALGKTNIVKFSKDN